MSRILAAFVLLPLLLCVKARAQGGGTAPLWPTEIIGESSGGFSFGVRLLGRANVTFSGIGDIPSTLNSGDATSEMVRLYSDGFVATDSRTTSSGLNLPDDGFTNTWTGLFDDQVLPDASGIAFHNYSTISDGSTADASSDAKPGVDLELSWRFGGFGKRMQDNRRSGSWGAFAGFGVTDINAKDRATFTATLHSITDLYSFDGATPPYGNLQSPTTDTVTVIGPDGTPTVVSLNTTTLLTNRPYSRTETDEPGAASIDGFWQARGAYFAIRGGVWSRWHVTRQLSIRASVGLSFSYIGLDTRYDELLTSFENLRTQVRDSDATDTLKYTTVGVFGSIDLELWLTRRTGLFGSVVYEGASKDMQIPVGGRTADVRLSSGTGFRIGITTLF